MALELSQIVSQMVTKGPTAELGRALRSLVAFISVRREDEASVPAPGTSTPAFQNSKFKIQKFPEIFAFGFGYTHFIDFCFSLLLYIYIGVLPYLFLPPSALPILPLISLPAARRIRKLRDALAQSSHFCPYGCR